MKDWPLWRDRDVNRSRVTVANQKEAARHCPCDRSKCMRHWAFAPGIAPQGTDSLSAGCDDWPCSAFSIDVAFMAETDCFRANLRRCPNFAPFQTFLDRTILNQAPIAFFLSGIPMSDPNSVTIRPLRSADRAEWCQLWQAYLAFYETVVPDEVYDVTFQRLLGDDRRDFNAFVAELDGRLVGLVHYLFHRHAWKVEEVCYLQDLFAHPDVRGTGVGRKLIEEVYHAADHNGTPSVYWLTQDFNVEARKLYDRIGALTPFIRYQRPQ